jgi:hypothetical protein
VPPSRSDSGSAEAAWPIRAAAALPLAVLAVLWGAVVVKGAVALQVIAAAMALLAFASPAAALVACAGLTPPIRLLGDILVVADPRRLTESLALSFLVGWFVRGLVRPGPKSDRATRAAIRPALIFGAVVAASAVAVWWTAPRATGQALSLRAWLGHSAASLVAGAAISLEGLGLFVASVTLVGRARASGRAVVMVVAGASIGVAAWSIAHLLEVWRATGGAWPRLLNDFVTLRIRAAFPDPNSAGSYLAMGLAAALGLAFAALARSAGVVRPAVATRRGLGWLAAAATIAVGLWLTGSRSAFVAIVPAALVLLALVPRVPRWIGWSSVAAVALVFVGLLPFVAGRLDPPRAHGGSLPQATVRQAAAFRFETTTAALKMIADHPVFGVGIGGFYARSGEYFSPGFRAVVPHENAHNNFLQVLAELGIVGFLPFVWLIGAVGAAVWNTWRSGHLSGAAAAGAAGLLAFVLTWLTGHPLLVPEAAHPFWIMLGTVAGLACDGDPAITPGVSTPSISGSIGPGR